MDFSYLLYRLLVKGSLSISGVSERILKIELSCFSDSLRVNCILRKTSFGGIAYALFVEISRLKYKLNYYSKRNAEFLKYVYESM